MSLLGKSYRRIGIDPRYFSARALRTAAYLSRRYGSFTELRERYERLRKASESQ